MDVAWALLMLPARRTEIGGVVFVFFSSSRGRERRGEEGEGKEAVISKMEGEKIADEQKPCSCCYHYSLLHPTSLGGSSMTPLFF